MWGAIKKAINGMLGKRNFKPLDGIVSDISYQIFFDIMDSIVNYEGSVLVVPFYHNDYIAEREYASNPNKLLVLPPHIKNIRREAFTSSQFHRVKIPSSVERIENLAFNDCRNIRFVKFQPYSKLNYIGHGAFRNLSPMEFIELPNSLRNGNIESSAFEGCSSLINIYVPWAEGEGPSGAPWGASNPDVEVIYGYNAYREDGV